MTLDGGPSAAFVFESFRINFEARWEDPPQKILWFHRDSRQLLQRVRDSHGRVGFVLTNALVHDLVVVTYLRNLMFDFPEMRARRPAMTVHWERPATRRGEPARRADDPSTPQNEGGQPDLSYPRGSGEGSPAYIYADWEVIRERYAVGADAVLVHELGHALRATTGTQTSRGMGPIPDHPHDSSSHIAYPNREEYFAQVVMNMYLISEGRAPLLGYAPWVPGYARVTSSPNPRVRAQRRWQQAHIRELMRLAGPLGPFLHMIRQLPSEVTPYNPFRDVDNPRAAVILPR